MGKPDTTKAVRLTERERDLIRHALRIASEDGSIFNEVSGDADENEGVRRIAREIEKIEAKL